MGAFFSKLGALLSRPGNLFSKIAVLCAFLSLAACIALPVAVPEEAPFTEQLESFFTPGETTRQEVLNSLSGPWLMGDNWMIYHQTRQGWSWVFCGAAYYSAGCSEATPRTVADFFLLLEFDDYDVLASQKQIRNDELCRDRRICFEKGLYTQADSQARENSSKEYRAPAGGCGVYIYTGTDLGMHASALYLNGKSAGSLVGTQSYHHLEMPFGAYELLAVPAGDIFHQFAGKIDFECLASEVIFLRYRGDFWRFPGFDRVDNKKGRDQVAMRWLAKPPLSAVEKHKLGSGETKTDDSHSAVPAEFSVELFETIESTRQLSGICEKQMELENYWEARECFLYILTREDATGAELYDAKFALGQIHELGLGVKPDLLQAQEYYREIGLLDEDK
ncbi:MAG: SEL1-like repeat protein [bacterium]